MNINQLVSFSDFNEVAHTKPQLVIIDIGTIDLDNISTKVEAEAQALIKIMINKLFLFARKLVWERGVRHVVFLQVLPRWVGKYRPKNTKFQTYVNMFNNRMKCLWARQHKKQHKLHYWVHPRMQSNVGRLLSDGVHLNERGLKKYFHSLKQAVAHYAVMC
jgi:lysophospholipase L1-like esterase